MKNIQIAEETADILIKEENKESDIQISEIVVEPPKNSQKQRLICLDVLRGLTMVGMILVDDMGDYDALIWPLRESDWDGITTADCIFPCFIFVMGLAIPLALKPQDRGKWPCWQKILKRFLLLFIIGVFLNIQRRIPDIFTSSPFVGFRVMGVF